MTNLEQLTKSRDGWREEALCYRERYEEIERKMNAINAAINGDVWYFQDDGEDYPESLTCNVVMSAYKLREILNRSLSSQST